MLATYVRALNVRRAQYTALRARLPYLLSLKINNPMYVHYTCVYKQYVFTDRLYTTSHSLSRPFFDATHSAWRARAFHATLR